MVLCDLRNESSLKYIFVALSVPENLNQGFIFSLFEDSCSLCDSLQTKSLRIGFVTVSKLRDVSDFVSIET